MNIGFIGLGTMGRSITGRLLGHGHQLFVHSRKPAPAELLDKGARDCRSSKDVAANSDVIILMVPDTPDVEAVLFGTDGVSAKLSAGKTVVDMSSISPISTKEFARRIN